MARGEYTLLSHHNDEREGDNCQQISADLGAARYPAEYWIDTLQGYEGMFRTAVGRVTLIKPSIAMYFMVINRPTP